MKKILFGIAIFFTLILSASALDLSSENVVLYNMNERNIVFKQSENEITSIASLTKIMTTLVAIEQIENYDEIVTINSSMLKGLREANAAVAGLKVGQKVTYFDLLYATFLASGADAARALTISLAGSEDNFVKLMNDKANSLGLTNTNFTNTTGLDEEGQTSTVDEVARLLIAALDNQTFKEIFYTKSYLLSDKSLTVYSTLIRTANNFNLDVSYFLGGKTGYTDNAGRCLASLAYDEENDITYLLVTTNAAIKNGEHVKDAIKIYNYYFENYKYHNLVDEGDTLITLPTKYAKEAEVSIYATEDLTAYLENTFTKDDVKALYKGENLVKGGQKKGDIVGTLEISYNDIVYQTIDLILAEDVDFSVIVFAKENIIIIIVPVLLIGMVIFLLMKKKKRKKRKK